MGEALTITIITCISSAVGALIWYVIKRFTERLTDKIDELIKAVGDLSERIILNTTHIGQNSSQIHDHSGRLNDHSKRLRGIELKQASCKNCTT